MQTLLFVGLWRRQCACSGTAFYWLVANAFVPFNVNVFYACFTSNVNVMA